MNTMTQIPVATLGKMLDRIAELERAREVVPLRDYFAAHFMERAQSLSETRDGGWDFVNASQCCYAMADEMLKARQS